MADVNIWFWQHPNQSGIFNLGTGKSRTFNELAKAIIAWHKRGKIKYIPFPNDLRGQYQCFTEADVSKLRRAGFNGEFKTIEEGIKIYLDWLNSTK